MDTFDPEEALEYHLPPGAKANKWYRSHNFRHGFPGAEPEHTFDDGSKVCEFCLDHCTECNAPLCEHLDLESDSEGYPFPSPNDPHRDNVCGDCLPKVEHECTLENIRSNGNRYLKENDQVEREVAVLVEDAEAYIAALKQVVMPFASLPVLVNRGEWFGRSVPEDWVGKVFDWLWKNNQSALEDTGEGGACPSDEDLQEAITSLGWLSDDYKDIDDNE